MHGNVWEWCRDDKYDDYIVGEPSDNHVWNVSNDSESKFQTIRGGSWNRSPADCRSANRHLIAPADQDSSVGFRVVCLSSRGLS